jgi:nucleoid DNA-binding protein
MADNKAKPKTAKASTGGNKPMTKAAITQEVADATGLSKKQVQEVFGALTKVIEKQLGKKGPGVFNLLGLVKLKTKRKPATKERQGPSPFDKSKIITYKARPASTVVKARALRPLNDLVNPS